MYKVVRIFQTIHYIDIRQSFQRFFDDERVNPIR